MQDSERKTPDSLQKLTECLCDGRKMPLLQDPALAEVDLCYKAIPHYKSFVTKRETQVNKRIKEGEEAARIENETQGEEREMQKQKREQVGREIPHENRKYLQGNNQPIPIKNEHEFAHLYLHISTWRRSTTFSQLATSWS